MSKFILGATSYKRLEGLHPDLIKVVLRALELSTQDFFVLCGLRTMKEQKELYELGRTKPGNIVTWTLKSRHLPGADGFGRAVDLCPYPVDWNTPSKFDAIAKAMSAAAKELNINIRWGADWDSDGKPREKGESDSPHFELA